MKSTLCSKKQYNLLYGDVLTNAQIEEGERVNVHYGPLFRGQTIVRRAVLRAKAKAPN